jgi:tetratricopeptide (TPR) repeat protein
VTSPQPDAADFVELAKVEGANGNPGAGIEVLRRLEAFRPAAIDTSVVALDMALRISANQAGSALGRAERWVARSRVPGRDVLPLASVFAAQGYPALALKLLAPLAAQSRDPALILVTSQAEIDAGSREQALRRLETFSARARDRISPELAQLRLRLAASMNMHPRAAEAAIAMGIPSIPADLLPAAATASTRSGRGEIAEAIRARLQNEQASLRPVHIAETFLALGDRTAASEWARRAAPDANADPETAIRLARLELNLMHRNLALAALRSGLPFVFWDGQQPVFEGDGHVPQGLLAPISRLYAELGMAAEGLLVLELLLEKQPSTEAEQAWALSAAMARRSEAVIDWLKTNGERRINPDFLKELVFVATRSGSQGLALSAATRLAQDRGTDSDRMLLAELKVMFGAPLVRMRPSGSLASSGPLDRAVTR